MRQIWLTERFPKAHVLAFDQQVLDQLCHRQGLASREIPMNENTDSAHRRFMAWLCSDLLTTTVDALFTSESYGPGFAAVLSDHFTDRCGEFVTVQHVSVDQQRREWPISGTALRTNRSTEKNYVNAKVRSDLSPRIAVLGGESSGKTSLSQALASQLGCKWVPEYGRTLWEQRNGMLYFDDMLAIAKEQVRQERELAQSDSLLICDTTPLVTEFYSQEIFGKVDPLLGVLSQRQYAKVFLCAGDFEFVQDGTRRDDAFRQRQQNWYVQQLNLRAVDYIMLTGSLEARLEEAKRKI